MIYGFYSKNYSGLISDVQDGSKLICETRFEQGSGDLKIEVSMNGADWFTVLDTSSSFDITGEELTVPVGLRGSNFQFRTEIDIDPGVEDIDTAGNIIWGLHPKEREGEQVNFYRADDDTREAWTVTGVDGIWEQKLAPGYYYCIYDYQQDIGKLNLPPNQFIVAGSGNLANRFGDDIQTKFKQADEVYLTSTFLTLPWSKYLVTDLGTREESPKRDLSFYAENLKIDNGRLYKGDAYFEFIGFNIGKL